jgi:hypothetical protein
MMHRTSVLMIGFVLFTGTAALAQLPPQPPPPPLPMAEGTAQERAACHPDVIRFCTALVRNDQSDVFAILGCLQEHRTRISVACNNVLTSHGQ